MPTVRTVTDVGAVIRAARVERGWTQAELSLRADVSRRWVSAMEAGDAQRTELARVLRVLAALGVSLTATTSGEVALPPAVPRFDLAAHLATFDVVHPGPDR